MTVYMIAAILIAMIADIVVVSGSSALTSLGRGLMITAGVLVSSAQAALFNLAAILGLAASWVVIRAARNRSGASEHGGDGTLS